MSVPHHRPRLPLAAVVVAVVVWGVAPLFVRAAQADSATVILWRVLLALPLAVAVAYLTGGGMSLAVMRGAVVTGVCFAVSIITGFSSFRETSIANATLIPALQPALILVLAGRMFGEQRTRAEVLWAIVAFAGVSAVVLGASGQEASLAGDLLAVANLLVFTLYFLLAKRARTTNVHSWSFLAAVFTVTVFVVTPWAVAVNGRFETLHGMDWLYVLAIVVGPGLIGHGFMTWAHHYVDVTVTSMLTLANPVVSIVGAWLVFSEALGPAQIVGTVTVLAALGMIVRHQRGVRALAAEAALTGDLLDEGPRGTSPATLGSPADSLPAMRFDEQFVSIPRLALAGAERFPGLEAVVDGDQRITYPQLADAVIRSTRAAIAAGIEPGDRAAVWAPNSAAWIVAALGVLGAGGVLVTLNTRFKGGEAAYVLRKSGAKVCFTVNGFLDTDYPAMLRAALAESGEDLPDLARIVVLDGAAAGDDLGWDEYLGAGAAVTEAAARDRIDAIRGDDLADIMFTSGTTGRPKGAMSTHAQNLRVYEVWSEVVGLREGDRYLIVNPFFHGFGYKAGWFASIMRGATIVPMPVFDVPAVLEKVQAERITVLPGPPTLLSGILEYPDRDRYDLSSLRLTVTGAAVVPVELIRRLRGEGIFETIITGYGLTETTGTVSMCRYDDDPETIANFSGRAIPDIELRIVDEHGNEVPRGQPGEVVTRGYHLMKGYFGDEAETAATIDADGWLHTGDIGVMDERGYIRITDRLKDMYIVGGFNAYPAEIEGILLEHEKIAQVAVVGVPDERMGEVGMAFVVPRTGASLDPDEVIAWARDHMANYKVPRYVEICSELPVNANGKVVKYELRERAKLRST